MKYQVTEDPKDTICNYEVRDGIIYVNYLDGHIVSYDYTELKEKNILNIMLKQAKMLISQKDENQKYENEYRDNHLKYFSVGLLLNMPLLFASNFFWDAVRGKKNVVEVSLLGVIMVTILYSAIRCQIKAMKCDKNAALARDRDMYMQELECFLEFMEDHKEALSNPIIKELDPPLNINTFDEYIDDKKRLSEVSDLIFSIELSEYVDDFFTKFMELMEGMQKPNYASKTIETIQSEMDEEKAPAISTYEHLEDYHYEHKPKVLSKVLVNPFKDLDI